MKKLKETFLQSILALLVSQIIVKILGLGYKLYLTNKSQFGDEGNAITSASFQVYALFLSITSIGVPSAISKLVAERLAIGDHKGAYKIFRIALALFSIIGIIGSYILYYGAKIISSKILGMAEVEISLIALAPSIFLVSVISVYKGYFNGREKMSVTANAQTYDQITKTIITVIIIEIVTNVSNITNISTISAIVNFITTIANIIELTYLYIIYKKELPEIKKEIIMSVNYNQVRTLKTIKQILYVAIPMSLTPLIATAGKNIDASTIINGLQNNMSYENAKIQYGILNGKVDTLINFPLSFSGTVSTALIPGIAAAKKTNKITELEKRINISLLIGLIIALPVTMIFIGFSSEILKLLFPNASSGEVILKLSSLSIIFISIEQTIRGVLIGLGNNKIPIILISIGVIVKLILNKVLIPLDNSIGGINGAVIANLVLHSLIMILGYVALKKEIKVKFEMLNILKILIASIILLIVCKLTYSLNILNIAVKIKFILSIIVGIISYFFVIIYLRVIDLKQINILKKHKNKQKV